MFDPLSRYQLAVCPRGKTPADEYYYQGQVWIEGRDGSDYTLRFFNRTAHRVLAIFSVDGLDVLNGQPAGHLSEGYLVAANSSIDVPGWRVDANTAAEFVFGKVGKSYVSKMGYTVNNAGVIGAMVFQEAISSQIVSTVSRSLSTISMPMQFGSIMGINQIQTSSSAASNSMGTGFGQAAPWQTASAQFVRANQTQPDALMALYYDSAKGLQRRGIVLKSRYSASTSNNPFPAYTTGVKPPPGWKQ